MSSWEWTQHVAESFTSNMRTESMLRYGILCSWNTRTSLYSRFRCFLCFPIFQHFSLSCCTCRANIYLYVCVCLFCVFSLICLFYKVWNDTKRRKKLNKIKSRYRSWSFSSPHWSLISLQRRSHIHSFTCLWCWGYCCCSQ